VRGCAVELERAHRHRRQIDTRRSVHVAHVVSTAGKTEIVGAMKEVIGVDETAAVPHILATVEPYRPMVPGGSPV